MTDPEFVSVTATCGTEGCMKQGEAVPGLLVSPDPWPPNVVCGACGQPITEITREDG